MPTFSSRFTTAGLNEGLEPPMGTMDMDSTPPAIMTSASPTRMRSAAIDTAVIPAAQKRFTVAPATVLGRPDSSAATLATFMPCSPSGIAQILGGGMVGTHAGDMIGEIALAIEMGADAVDIGKTI